MSPLLYPPLPPLSQVALELRSVAGRSHHWKQHGKPFAIRPKLKNRFAWAIFSKS